mgnify:FL=1
MLRLLAVPRTSLLAKGLGIHVAKSLTSQHLHSYDLPSRGFSSSSDDIKKTENTGFLEQYFGKEATEASPEFSNRWAMAVPAFVTHMCIGSPWAWSLIVSLPNIRIPVMGCMGLT